MLGAVLLGASSRSASPSPRASRARDRVDAGAASLGLDERLGRGADQRELVVELEEEEVRRRVDAAQRAVELERARGRRPLGALREDDLERVAGADVVLRDARRSARTRGATGAGGASPRRRRCRSGSRRAGRRGACSTSAGSPQSTSAIPDTWSKRTRTSATTKRLSGRSGPCRAAGPSARARDVVVARRSRRRARRAPPPPRGRRAASRSRRASSGRAVRARPTRAGTTRVPLPRRRRYAPSGVRRSVAMTVCDDHGNEKRPFPGRRQARRGCSG